MLVRDRLESWQIVLQTDHADLSGQFAAAWSPQPEPFQSVRVASSRHDDGWAVWERAPNLDQENGRPRNFLDVDVLSHLAFYRACIASVTDHDAYAGLLISMHGAGIYQQRYGTQPSLPKLTHAEREGREVEKFIHEQEDGYAARIAALGVSDDERWRNYKFLQAVDRLSLYFCLRDLEGGESDAIEPVPLDGSDVTLTIEPAGPWSVHIDPFPFSGESAQFTVLRRVLPKGDWADDDDFRRDFFATPPEQVNITVSGS